MKKTSKLLLLLALVCVLALAWSSLALASPAPATPPPDDYEDQWDEEIDWHAWEKEMMGYPYTEADAINVQVNGKFLLFDDARPVLTKGRTMVPYRALFEAMGAEVGWDQSAKTASAIFPDGPTISVSLGSLDMLATKDGATEKIVMDAAPYYDSQLGRVYVPVRFIAEAAGWDVEWDNYYRLVTLENTQAVIQAIDSRFANINRVLSLSNAVDPEKSYDYSLIGQMKVSLYGETRASTASMRGQASGSLGGQGLRLDLTLDSELGFAEDFLDVATGFYGNYATGFVDPDADPQVMEAMEKEREEGLEKIKQALRHSELSLIMDDASGDMFLRTTLVELLDSAGFDTEGIGPRTWIWLEQALAPGEIASALSMAGMTSQDLSLGSLLAELTSPREALEIADILYPFYGDEYFVATTSGPTITYRVNQNKAGLAAYLQQLIDGAEEYEDTYALTMMLQSFENVNSFSFSMQIRESNGALLDSSVSCRLDAPGLVPYVLTMEGQGTATSGRVSYALTGKYIGKIEASLSSTVKERSTPYVPQVPAGAEVVQIDY